MNGLVVLPSELLHEGEEFMVKDKGLGYDNSNTENAYRWFTVIFQMDSVVGLC